MAERGLEIVWSKRMPTEIRWELYNIAADRCEMNDLASKHPDRVEKMVDEWNTWARRVGVIGEPEKNAATNGKPTPTVPAPKSEVIETPRIVDRAITITGRVQNGKGDGVLVAHGGRAQGYAVHLHQGKLALDLRVSVTFSGSLPRIPLAPPSSSKQASIRMSCI